jgi:WD40 repeat protein
MKHAHTNRTPGAKTVWLACLLGSAACGDGLQSEPGPLPPPMPAMSMGSGMSTMPPGTGCDGLGAGGVRAIATAGNRAFALVGYGSGKASLVRIDDLSVIALSAHDRSVAAAAISADGEWVATGSEGGEILVSAAADGRLRRRIQAPVRVENLALAPDGAFAASRAGDSHVHLWRVGDGAEVWSRPVGDPSLLRFLDDGSTLLTTEGGGLVSHRRVTDGSIVREVGFAARPAFTDATGDGALLVGRVRDAPDGVGLWRASDPAPVWLKAVDYLSDRTRPVLSPDRRWVGYFEHHGEVEILRFDDGERLARLPGRLESVAFDFRGTSALVGDSEGTLHLLALPGGERKSTLTVAAGHAGPVHQVVFSPDGRTIASSSRDDRDSIYAATVKVWRASDGALLFTVTGGGGEVRRSVAFSPDSSTIATVTAEGRIRLANATDGREMAVLGMGARGVVFSADGRSVLAPSASGGPWRSFRRWRVADGAEELGIGGVRREALAFAFSPDGSTVAMRTEYALSLWRVTEEAPVWQVELEMPQWLEAVAFSPSGDRIALADGRVFDPADGHLIKDLRPADGTPAGVGADVSFSRDGSRLAFATAEISGPGSLRVVRTADWTVEETRPGSQLSTSFSPTDDRLLFAGDDRIVRSVCQMPAP